MTTIQRITRRTVGGWLREKRRRLRKSQMNVAREAGITQGSLSNYETGKREVTVATLLRLSAAVDADLGELIGADHVILLGRSRLAIAATIAERTPGLVATLAPRWLSGGKEIVGRGEYVPNTGELHWSDEYFLIFGWEVGEVEPSAELFMERLHPDDRQGFDQYCQRLIAGLSHVRGFDLRIVIPETGEVRRVRTQSRAEYDGEGTPLVLRGTITYRPPN